MMEGSVLAPFEDWSEVLMCPICHEFPLGRVVVCRLGHSFCEECVNRQSSKTCSQCRNSMEGEIGRNFVAEGILDNLTFPCPYRGRGCNVEGLRRGEVKQHADNCEQSDNVIRLCQRLGFQDCAAMFSFRDPRAYLEHVADGTHCSHKRVRANNEGSQSLLIRSFRRIHEPDFVRGFSFLPKLFELDRGVKILMTYFVPLAEGGGHCTDIYFAAVLMEDKRPAGGNSPFVVQFCAKSVGRDADMEWMQPVMQLEKSRGALEGFSIRVSISLLQQKCMRLEDTQLDLKIRFQPFLEPGRLPQALPPPVHVRSPSSVNQWARNLSPPARSRYVEAIVEVLGIDFTPEELAVASAAADDFLLSITEDGREQRENGNGAVGGAPSYAEVARSNPALPASSFVASIGAALRSARLARQPIVRVPRVNVPGQNSSQNSPGSSTNAPGAASNLPVRASATSSISSPNLDIDIVTVAAESLVSISAPVAATAAPSSSTSTSSNSSPPLYSRLPPPPPRISSPSPPPRRRYSVRTRTDDSLGAVLRPRRRFAPTPIRLSPLPSAQPSASHSHRSRSPAGSGAESSAASPSSRTLAHRRSYSQLNPPPPSSDEDDVPQRRLRTRRPNSLHGEYFMY